MKTIAAATCVLALGACSAIRPVPLPAAATEIEDAMAAMRAEAAKVGPAGLYPCDATVVLSVTGQAGATLGGVSLEGAKLGVTASNSTGNTVTITLRSAACGAQGRPGETSMLLRAPRS
jgi:hypothetical protein